MNKLFQLSALTLVVASTNAFAHHPAADIVDPEVYEMIEENISEVHLDMTFDDMGGNSSDVDTAMGAGDEAGNMVAEMGSGSEVASMADVEPAGQMGSRR